MISSLKKNESMFLPCFTGTWKLHDNTKYHVITCIGSCYFQAPVNRVQTRNLKQRISEHKSSIRRADPNYPVACHFNASSHPISSLRFQGIEHVQLPRGGDIDKRLHRRELYWIHTLDSIHPQGLNVDFDMSAML